MIADGLTKALLSDSFDRFVGQMGLVDIREGILDLVAQYVWHPGPGQVARHLRPLFFRVFQPPTYGRACPRLKHNNKWLNSHFYHKVDSTAFWPYFDLPACFGYYFA